jgi:hypothetical protein
VSVEEVVENTGFELAVGGSVPQTRQPDANELRLLRERIDPEGWASREIPG